MVKNKSLNAYLLTLRLLVVVFCLIHKKFFLGGIYKSTVHTNFCLSGEFIGIDLIVVLQVF